MARVFTSVAFATFVAVASTAQAPQLFRIDPQASQVIISVDRAGLLSFAGHTHEVVAPAVAGEVRYDAGDPARSSVRVEFDASALKVTGKGEPRGDVPEVQRVMLSERVLDVRRYPTIAFASRSVSVVDRHDTALVLAIAGDLTLHGVTRPLTIRVAGVAGPDEIRARGSFFVKQTDFGIQPVTAGAGTVKVKDALQVTFALVAWPS